MPCRIDEASEIPETEPAPAFVPATDVARVMGRPTFWRRGLPPLKEVVRTCEGGGRTKRSATDDGGERGREVRTGRLPGELTSESR